MFELHTSRPEGSVDIRDPSRANIPVDIQEVDSIVKLPPDAHPQVTEFKVLAVVTRVGCHFYTSVTATTLVME